MAVLVRQCFDSRKYFRITEDNKMKIMEAIDRNPTLTGQLLEVWESSVKATHLFLSEEEIENIKNYVPQAIQEIPYLIIAVNEHQVPVGFMGIAEQHFFITEEEKCV